MKSFISLEEAIDILDANVKAIGTEEVELIKSTGRIISEDIYSKIDNPPFNKSAMDGYAIIAEDSNDRCAYSKRGKCSNKARRYY